MENKVGGVVIKNIRYMKINELRPLDKNPFKSKGDRQIERIAKSIEDFERMMEIRKIVIDENNQILGGNKRYFALKKLGYKEIPDLWIEKVTDLSEEQKKEFIIKDNAHWGSEWDLELLEEWKVDLEAWGVGDVEFADEKEAKEDDYEIPDEIETDIVLGDLIEIGEHRLLCGDSTDSEQVAKLMNGKKADMVFTDPPYNVNYGISKNQKNLRTIKNDNMDIDHWLNFCNDFMVNIKNFNNGDIYMFGASAYEGMVMRILLIEMGCHWSSTIIWKKDQLVLTPANYQRMYEPCFYGWFNKSSFNGDRKQVDVWEVNRPKNSKLHPTMKPIELSSKGIQNSSKEGDIVLDLFLGSGSTMVAAHQLNRKCYGMELEPKYCQVIVNRMRELDYNLVIKKNGVEI